MKKKKVFIISYNKLPIEFWNKHLNLDNNSFWLWDNNPNQGIKNLSKVLPDIVIIDGYWAKYSFMTSLREVLCEKYISNIFCITPERESASRLIFMDQRLNISRFTNEVITEINTLLNPSQNDSHTKLNKTA
jgi:chemotaxis response regulator CheB